MKKVLILGITNLQNMGDNLIAEATEYLVKSCCSDSQVVHGELFLRWRYQKGVAKIIALLWTLGRIVFERIKMYHMAELMFRYQHQAHYRHLLLNCDYAIITSGMLKYTSQSHAYMYCVLCQEAEILNKPLLLNAKSIQQGNCNDPRFKRVKTAIRRKGIYINTRDGEEGVKILKNDYDVDAQYVGDPALWAAELYGKPDQEKNEMLVGVNLIRPSIYQSYGNIITSDEVISLYIEILKELDRRKIKWTLFCNGMPDDAALALHVSEKSKVIIPTTPQELVESLCSFSTVLGFRLHACITSVALNIPVVGMIWDPKTRLFAQSIELSDFFIEPNELNAKYIVDKIELSQHKQTNREIIEKLKIRTKTAICAFLNQEKGWNN